MLRARVGFHIDEPHRIVTVRYVGAICGDEIVPQMQAAYRSLARAWTYDCIHDLRRHTGRMDIRDNETLARCWQEVAAGRDVGRCTAILSSDPLIDARLPLTQAMFPFRSLAVFRTIETARMWIDSVRAGTDAMAMA